MKSKEIERQRTWRFMKHGRKISSIWFYNKCPAPHRFKQDIGPIGIDLDTSIKDLLRVQADPIK